MNDPTAKEALEKLEIFENEILDTQVEKYRKEKLKAYGKEYRQRPEVQARRAEYFKEYRNRPGVKERMREASKRYQQRQKEKKVKNAKKCVCGGKPVLICPLQTTAYDVIWFRVRCSQCGLHSERFNSSISAREAWNELIDKIAGDKKGRKKE